MKAFTFDRFGIRLLFAVILVFASYNPSGWSYYHWVMMVFPGIDPYIALAGILLSIGWVIYLRATLRSLGIIGLGLVAAVCGCLLWMLYDWGVLTAERSSALTWIILVLQSLVLAIGMSWSHIRRRMSGQVDIDDVDEG